MIRIRKDPLRRASPTPTFATGWWWAHCAVGPAGWHRMLVAVPAWRVHFQAGGPWGSASRMGSVSPAPGLCKLGVFFFFFYLRGGFGREPPPPCPFFFFFWQCVSWSLFLPRACVLFIFFFLGVRPTVCQPTPEVLVGVGEELGRQVADGLDGSAQGFTESGRWGYSMSMDPLAPSRSRGLSRGAGGRWAGGTGGGRDFWGRGGAAGVGRRGLGVGMRGAGR